MIIRLNDRLTEGSDYGLWYLAYENDKPVGFIIGRNEASCTWVDLLGVGRSARKQGIGKALLQLIFKESYNRRVYTVGLNVDADSPTNAHKLYERVGMKPVFQIAMYERSFK
jgi:GNAT superfamily N-acetyltransferase